MYQPYFTKRIKKKKKLAKRGKNEFKMGLKLPSNFLCPSPPKICSTKVMYGSAIIHQKEKRKTKQKWGRRSIQRRHVWIDQCSNEEFNANGDSLSRASFTVSTTALTGYAAKLFQRLRGTGRKEVGGNWSTPTCSGSFALLAPSY